MKLSHTIAALLLAPYLLHAIDSIGVVSGQTGTVNEVFGAQVLDSGQVNSLNYANSNPPFLYLPTVAISPSGIGLIGGAQYANGTTPLTYAALVYPNQEVLVLQGLPRTGYIFHTAMNSSSLGIISGLVDVPDSSNTYVAYVTDKGELTPLGILPMGLGLYVDINDSGRAIMGFNNYVAFASPNGIVTPLPLLGDVSLNSVAINGSEIGLIGGTQNSGADAYAALVSSPSSVTPLTVPTGGSIKSVALIDTGLGLIGGDQNSNADAYAAWVSSTGVVTPIATLPTNGAILSVALNEAGLGLIGGTENGNADAYAAYVTASGTVTPLSPLPIGNSSINSVAINQVGAGLIGGSQGTNVGYLALVTPTGTVMQLTVSSTVPITSVAFSLFNQISTVGLSGNNQTFANYLNRNASETAFYFLPSALDGTLSRALESAAPTRNALSFFTASNNLFYLNHSLSNHLQNAHHFRDRETTSSTLATGPNHQNPDELTAAIGVIGPRRGGKQNTQPAQEERPYTIWVDALGAFAKQKSQHETVGFEPNTGAVVVGFDAVLNPKVWVGGGAAYSYTHIHEKKDDGHSNINQEYLFVYSSYAPSKFYLDAALWTGFFQTSQVRHIHMAGFDFNAKSHPHGWQLAPHLELGYNAIETKTFVLDPFVMLDWVASWQNGFKEKGGSPFNVQQKHHFGSLLRAEAGLRFFETIYFNRWNLVLEEKGSYVRREPFKTGSVTATLIGSPGSFTVETLSNGQNLAVLEFGATFEPKDQSYPYGTVDYQAEFNGNYQSHQVLFEIGWNF